MVTVILKHLLPNISKSLDEVFPHMHNGLLNTIVCYPSLNGFNLYGRMEIYVNFSTACGQYDKTLVS